MLTKYSRKKLIQACSEGDLDTLKHIYNYDNISSGEKHNALHYSIRSCNIGCVEYLLEVGDYTLVEIERNRDLIWSIINRNGIGQEKRISMFVFLFENDLEDSLEKPLNIYATLKKIKYFKMTLDVVYKYLDLDVFLVTSTNADYGDNFIEVIKQKIRTKKIENLFE